MADPVKRRLEELRAAGAPEFFERDPAVIKARLKAKFEAVSGRTLYPAQAEMFLIDTASYALSLLNEAAQTGVLQNTVVWAEGRHLEERAANVSTFRLLAQPAVTRLEFRVSAVRVLDTAIPKGTRVSADNAVTFATDADLVIPAGMLSATVTATAEATGARWNGIGIGKVTDILDPVAYVTSVGNIAEVTGGTDMEDQERFRARVADALHTISKSGPVAGYREHVMAVSPEIVDVAVIRPQPGYIHIYPLVKTGLPSAALKAAVLAYLDPETLRPMGDYVSVFDPDPVKFEMTLAVRVREASMGLDERIAMTARKVFGRWTRELGAQIAPSEIVAAVKNLTPVVDVSLAGFGYRGLEAHQFASLDALTVNIVMAKDG